jgi:hypothetical protein
MNTAISGAILLGHWAIGLYFFQFRRQSGDRLFGFFACAFWLMAAERLVLLCLNTEHEVRPYVYVIRLIAFLFFLFAIYDKNRNASDQPGPTKPHQGF